MDNDYISRGEHEEFVKRMEDEHKRLNNRMVILEKASVQMQELITNVGKMAVNMEHMVEEQREQGRRLDKIENEPKNAWDSIKKGLYNAIGAAVGGAIIAALLFFM